MYQGANYELKLFPMNEVSVKICFDLYLVLLRAENLQYFCLIERLSNMLNFFQHVVTLRLFLLTWTLGDDLLDAYLLKALINFHLVMKTKSAESFTLY